MPEKILKKRFLRAKEDLEDLETYIKEFSAFLPLSVCTINPLGMIVDVNKAAESLIGCPSFKIVGNSITSIFLEKEEVERIGEETKKKKSVQGKELTLVSKKNKKIPVSVSASGRNDKAGNYIGYFLALSDITGIKMSQKSLEKKAKERTRELQERVEELEKFHRLTVGRELKMVALKNRIRELENKLRL